MFNHRRVSSRQPSAGCGVRRHRVATPSGPRPVGRTAPVAAVVFLGFLGAAYGIAALSGGAVRTGAVDGIPEAAGAPWPWTPTLEQAPVNAVPIVLGGSGYGFQAHHQPRPRPR